MGANDKVDATFHPWHDEADRFQRTGHLDEGACRCGGCNDTPNPG